jgi:hypothetical protein
LGTTVLRREKGLTTAEFFAREFGAKYAQAVRATAMVNGVFYAVVEVPAAEAIRLVPDENGMVRYCWVVLTGSNRRTGEFSYKEMTEFCGPCEATCPERLLDMLSPLKDCPESDNPSDWARGWRQRCRDRIALDKALVVGREFTTDYELNFRSFKANRFTLIERRGTTMRFRVPNGTRVRLTASVIADLKAVA